MAAVIIRVSNWNFNLSHQIQLNTKWIKYRKTTELIPANGQYIYVGREMCVG